MTNAFELVLVSLVLTTAGAAILVKDLISAVFILGSYSFFLALVWAWLGAPDLAFVEAVVGAGLGTVLLLLTLSQMRPRDIAIRRTRPPLAAFLALVPVASAAPGRGGRPASLRGRGVAGQSPRRPVLHREQHGRDPDAERRDLDHHGLSRLRHLIETCVIFTAGIACAAILRRANDSGPRQRLVQTISRVLIPLVQLYAVYIVFFGQYLARRRIRGRGHPRRQPSS